MGVAVRIENLAINGFKNVRHGEISLGNTRKQFDASILALYGQNGSGKTALIDVVGLLQVLLRGEKMGPRLVDCINNIDGLANVVYTLRVDDGNDGIYLVKYSVDLEKKPDDSAPGIAAYKAQVKRETLSCSYKGRGASMKMQPIIDTAQGMVFGPVSKYKTIVGNKKETEFDLAVAKKISSKESRSYLFSPELTDAVRANCQDERIAFLLEALVSYGHNDLFVVSTATTGFIGLGALPLNVKYNTKDRGSAAGSVMIPLDDAADIPIIAYDVARTAVDNMNVVLTQIVPGLTIAIKDLGKCLLPNGEEGVRVQLTSQREGMTLPFRCESDGVKKIVSILQLLIAVYNQPSVTVAIDELDSGIFEYLLGEILRILSEGGHGQLVFTSHNLRPLETIDRGFVAFTTTNPDNRYIRFTNVKPKNNLRDFYYRDIILGEQGEPVYEETSNGEIAYALRIAGGN